MPTLPAIVAPNTPAATPGLIPGTGTPAAGFGFEALLALLLGVGQAPAAPAAAATDAPADGATDDETTSEAAGSAAAGALAAGAQAASAIAVAGEASPGAETATATTPTAADAAVNQVTQGKAEVRPTKPEGGTLGSRAVAGVVEEEKAGVALPETGADTGTRATPSAPSDLPSQAKVQTVTAVEQAAAPADDATAVLRDAEHPRVETRPDGTSADRPHPVNALGGADAVALDAAHAGTHRETGGGDARREPDAPHTAPAEAPAPPTVPFHAPVRDASHVEPARLEAPAARAPELPEPPHVGPRSEMRLEVASDDLGKVEVRVVVRADGVHATLVAGQDQAREALTQHRSALEEALGRAQLRLDGFTVGQGPNDGRQQQERFDRSGIPTATQTGTPIGLAAAPATAPGVVEHVAGKGLSLRA